MRNLVTGAAGHLGSGLISALVAAGDEVVASDIREPSRHTAAHSWVHLDVASRLEVAHAIAVHSPDRVIHLAATHCNTDHGKSARTYDVNIGGTKNILDACVENDVPTVLYASSMEVFGGRSACASDSSEICPTTMYGVTKANSEILGSYYRYQYGLDFRGLRYPSVVSPYRPNSSSYDYAAVLFHEAVRAGECRVRCRKDTRIPLIYIADATRALVRLADAPRDTLTRSVYNIASISPRADEVAGAIQSHLKDAKVLFEPEQAQQALLDSLPDELDDTKARKDWGWRPSYDLDRIAAELIPLISDSI